jgi:class 3 adenylate cyclase/tetratricopeptide (TPR) repeat protein
MSLPSSEERRMVTVLFGDLVGFTTRAERLDPEAVKALVDGCFERVVAVITSFGGRVDKLLGDGVVALFGAPVAHEDDAERAVRCALRIQQTLQEYSGQRAELLGGVPLQMRIGINTGEVLTGTVAGTDYTAMGDAVNTAARLQSVADPGTVLVGASTRALTRHTIRYDDATSAELRGRTQSEQVSVAVEAFAPPGRRRRRAEVAFVGRAQELAVARAALDVAVAGQHSVTITITGENGVGKSRLADELVDGLQRSEVAVLQGTCVPYGVANAWWPIATALGNYLDVDATAPAEEVAATARARAQKLGDHLADADVQHLVDTFLLLLGLPSALDRLDPMAQRLAVHNAVTQVVSLRAAQRPFVLVIHDLHWADQEVIDLLHHLSGATLRLPLALITTMRPDTDVQWPPTNTRLTSIVIHLHPLSAEETAQLAQALLADEQPSSRLLTSLFDRSGGNPLFLQELAALNNSGGELTTLPDSLRALISARLDQLSHSQRQVLDNAATLGTSGIIGALQRFADEMGQDFDPTTVDELEDLGLLERQGRRWAFRSESVRDAAYQTITKANRAVRHAGVAKAIAGTGPHMLDDTAHHLASAAELITELGRVPGVDDDIVARAIDALHQAALRASAAGNARTAIRQATRALDLSDPAHPLRTRIRLLRADQLVEQRRSDEALSDVNVIIGEAQVVGDLWAEGEARRALGRLRHAQGNLTAARDELAVSTELLRSTDRLDSLAETLRSRGFIELFGGVLTDAAAHFDEAHRLYAALGDERGLAWIEQHRAWLAFLRGNLDDAHKRLHAAEGALRELGDRNGVGWAAGLRAFVEFFRGDFAEAEQLARQVAGDAAERGDEWATAMMQTLQSNLALWQGQLETALQLAENARSRMRKIGDRFGQLQAAAPLLRAQVALGRTAAVQRTFEEVVALADAGLGGSFPLLVAAGAAMHRGDTAHGVDFAERALQATTATGAEHFEPYVILAVTLLQAGRVDDALVQLERAHKGAAHPFYESAAALVMAVAGDASEVLEHAGRVDTAAGATYYDRVIAFVAAAATHHRLGDAEHALLCAEAAAATALHVGDVVAMSLATAVYELACGRPHSAASAVAAPSDGWRRVIDGLFPVVADAQLDAASSA